MKPVNDNSRQLTAVEIPERVSIAGHQEVASINARSFISRTFPSPKSGYFLRAKGSDGEGYVLVVKYQFSADREDDGRAILSRSGGWDVEWYRTQRSAAKALKDARRFADQEAEWQDSNDEDDIYYEDAA